MEQRPLSKLAKISLRLSIASIISVLIVTIIILLDIELYRYIGTNLIIVLAIILSALILSSAPTIIISILALLLIWKNNLTGTKESATGIILSVLVILTTIFFIWPNMNRGHGGHAESSAPATLKLLTSAEATWRQQDCDENGIKDYWTYDISCFHRAYRRDNVTKVSFIHIDVARADMNPAALIGGTTPFNNIQIESWTDITPTQKYAYCYMAMISDENGMPYNQNPVGPNKILATNRNKFAFVAYPAKYGEYAVRTFIVNQEGTIYGRDMGSDVNKIVLRWPSPEEFNGEKPKWRVAD